METGDTDRAQDAREPLNALDTMRAVWRSDAVGTWQWDLHTGKSLWNTRMFELLGLDPTAGTISGATLLNTIVPEDRPRIESAIAESIRTAKPFEKEFQILRPDGERRWLFVRGAGLHGEPGAPSELLGVVIDITERKRDEIEVQRATRNLEVRLGENLDSSAQQPRKLRRLAAQLTQAELAERKRIAGLLHDTVQQTLVAAILGAEKARRQITNAGARDTLLKVITAIQEVVARTRLLSIQLDPPGLAQSTLSESLRWLAESKREHYGLRVTFLESAEPSTPSEEVKSFLFEAARELLFNVVKHGGVLAASMNLSVQDEVLYLSIDDEGQGCNLDLLGDPSGEQGLGLAMIRDRAAMLGGEISLFSAPHEGFHVRIRVPLRDD
ncbi:MAG: PAS domain-containing protein [Candidatus Hydrogenedentales bacterium]|jgi:PAS domain S-box-containing protein